MHFTKFCKLGSRWYGDVFHEHRYASLCTAVLGGIAENISDDALAVATGGTVAYVVCPSVCLCVYLFVPFVSSCALVRFRENNVYVRNCFKRGILHKYTFCLFMALLTFSFILISEKEPTLSLAMTVFRQLAKCPLTLQAKMSKRTRYSPGLKLYPKNWYARITAWHTLNYR